jgi:hypothetical protein
MQMPILMDNTHVVIFYRTSAHFTVPKKASASGRDLAFEAFWFHFVLIGERCILTKIWRILSGWGSWISWECHGNVIGPPCPILSRAVNRDLSGRTAAGPRVMLGEAWPPPKFGRIPDPALFPAKNKY